jgi:hypothetical protein
MGALTSILEHADLCVSNRRREEGREERRKGEREGEKDLGIFNMNLKCHFS